MGILRLTKAGIESTVDHIQVGGSHYTTAVCVHCGDYERHDWPGRFADLERFAAGHAGCIDSTPEDQECAHQWAEQWSMYSDRSVDACLHCGEVR